MNNHRKQGLLQTFKGVMAAFLGVQSRQQHENDFRHGSAKNYIIVALVVVVGFILLVISVVQLVLTFAIT
ncbi:MAG: DUF2970 domain-containing protein [Gammaproteobacteria bacterium]|nr:DUF2970 domain-containing protein [Gammaproteobacteria bacterium]